MTITVNRVDISVDEELRPTYTGFETKHWSASLCGPLSTGEQVSTSRSGETFAQALANLEAAIAENGWEIR